MIRSVLNFLAATPWQQALFRLSVPGFCPSGCVLGGLNLPTGRVYRSSRQSLTMQCTKCHLQWTMTVHRIAHAAARNAAPAEAHPDTPDRPGMGRIDDGRRGAARATITPPETPARGAAPRRRRRAATAGTVTARAPRLGPTFVALAGGGKPVAPRELPCRCESLRIGMAQQAVPHPLHKRHLHDDLPLHPSRLSQTHDC